MPLKQVTRPTKREIEENRFETKWKTHSGHQTPLEKDYLEKLKSCFTNKIAGKTIVDLGCGSGELSRYLADLGAHVTAVDISPTALNIFDDQRIKKEQHFVPYTTLPDDHYDYVIAANLIAELPESEHRLFFSELARLVKPDGKVVVSTPLDINSEDALQKLLYLAETELDIDALHLSYHRLYIRGLPLFKYLGQNQDWLLKPLEKATQFLYDTDGASYVILLAHRKCLFEPTPEDHQPIEHKGKKAVWE